MAYTPFDEYDTTGYESNVEDILTDIITPTQPQQTNTSTTAKVSEEDGISSKLALLERRKQEKLQKLGTVSGKSFYDADSPYSRGTGINTGKNTLRMSNPENSTAFYVDAPEAPSTIENRQNRPATPEEIANYKASMVVKDNYMMGTTPASKEEIQDLIDNPLAEEDQKLYDNAMRQAYGEGLGTGILTGKEGNLDKYKRQKAQVYTDDAVEGYETESLQDRLLDTGVGTIRSYSKPVLADYNSLLLGEKEVVGKKVEQVGEARLSESIDLAQSQGLKFYADLMDAGRDASRAMLKGLNVEQGTIDEWLPSNAALLGTGQGILDVKNSEQLRDRIAGFRSRDAWNAEQAKYEKLVGEGNYVEAAWNVVTNLDRHLAQSAPEMAALMVPYAGLPMVVATRLNNQAEEFEEKNGRPMTGREMTETAATILGTLIPEKLLIKSGANKVLDKFKGKKGSKKDVAVGIGVSGVGETLQEGAESIQEQWATGKAEDRYDLGKLKEIATSDETIGGMIAGGVMGTALRGGGETLAVGADITGRGLTAGKEKLDNYMETAESENKGKATTQAGRKNKFDTVVGEGGRDLDIEESVKGDWVDDLSKYASEVWLSEDLKKGTEYEKTPTKIIDDTVDAIAKIKNVKSEEGKDLIRTGLFKRFFDESNAIDEKTGEAKPLTQDQKTGMLKVFLDKFKGNKQVENEAERQYEEVLKAKFAEIQNRLKSEGVNVDADFSSKGALTQGELDSLESILSDMKVMGSESLTELAEKVSQVMTKRQELLGSEDGENGPTKKDFKEVRKEIEELGFLLKGPNYKSIKQHKRDLEDYLTVEGADSVKGDEAMADIARFVKSRDGKIQMFDKSGDLEKLRSVGAIKFFAQTTLEDTRNMSAMLKEIFPKLKDEGVKQEFMGMITTLDGVEADLRDVVSEKDGAKLYAKLAERVSLTKPEKALLDKALQEYNDGVKEPETESPVESDAPVTPKIGANMKAFIDKEISKGESKENLLARMDTNGKISREMRAVIAEYIRGLEDVKVDDTVDTEERGNVDGEQKNLDIELFSKEELADVRYILDIYTSETPEKKGGLKEDVVLDGNGLKENRNVDDEDAPDAEMITGAGNEVSLKDYLPLRHGSKVNADVKALENVEKNEYTKKDVKRVQDVLKVVEETKADPDVAYQVWGIEPETSVVNSEIKDEKKEESTTSTETKEEPVVEEKPTSYTKEDVQFMQGMLDESEQELQEMKAELEKVTNINVETGGEIRSKRKEVGTTKAEKNDAKERIDELYEDIQAHNKLIDELLKNKKSKIAQKRALVAEIKAHKEKLEALGKKLEKLSANTEMKESQRMNAAGKLRKVLTDLVDRFRMVLNKIEQRIIKMSEMKAIKQLEANELQKEIQDLATQVDEVKASKERTREAIKEVMPEYRNLITDYKRALNDLEEAKAVRDDLLAVEGFDTEGLADYRAKYKDLKILIKGLKKDIATAFRLDVQEVVGDVAASNESNRRSLTNRLHFGEDIMEIMPKIIKASEKGKEKVANALVTFAAFERNRGALVNQDEGFANNPEKEVLKRLGLDKLFSDKTIQEKVKKAVNVTSLLTMNDMIGMRSMPGDMLKSAVEGAFGNVWSYADSGKRDGEIDWLVNQVRQGKIVPVATFADAAGRRLLEELEIKLDTENMQDRADATKLLGELVINNILPKSNKGTDPRKGIVARDEANGPLQIKVVSNGKGKQLPSIRVLDISTVPNDFRQDIQEAGNVFEYASETTDGMIGFSPITHESGKRGRNSDVIITDAEIAYLNEQGSKEWKFDPSFKNLWEEQAGKDLKKLKEMFLGTKEELAAKEHVMDVESAIAKYTAQELDLERMVMAYELAGDKPFYIGWDYTVSNRNMMNNKMINPQNSKFSRFIVSMKDMVNDVKVGDYTDVMLAISQAFDMDPDKQTDENAIKELRTGTDIKVDMEVKDGELVINELSENVQSIIDDDSVSVERIRKELAPGSDHLMHVYQALDLLQKVQRGEKLRTNLALEGDGITNGMATTTTQIGMNKDTKAYYEKMGMYDEDSEYGNHGAFKEAGGKDIYQTPEDAIIEELNDLSKVGEVVDGESELAKAVKNLVPKDGAGKTKWRGFLKPLVMVFIYGAGIQNISVNGSRGLAVSMVKDKDMQTGKDLLKAMDVFVNQRQVGETIMSEASSGKSTTSDALSRMREGLKTAKKVRYDLDTGKMVPDADGQMYVDQSMLNDMATVINASVGKALDGAFSKSFGPITKYRQVLKTVNEMNYLAFTVAFNKKLKDKFGATRLAELSKEQLVEIKDEMVKEGTYYGSTNMHGGTQDYFKTQQDTEFDGDTIEVRLSSTFGTFQSYKGSAQTINQTIKTIASNVGAVGVIDVHSVDGGTMIKGHIKDVLNIFDALVLGTNGALNNEQMKEINAAYYKINMEHSILGKAVEKLVKNSESLLAFDPEADAQIAKDVVADMKRIMGTGFDPKDMGNVVEGLMESVEEIHNSRHTLWNTDMNVKQYYVADRHEAAKWDEKARSDAKTDRIGVFANDESKAADEKQMLGNMFAVLGDIVKSSETVAAKAKTKSNIDIITQIDDVLNSIKEPEVKEKMKTWFKEELKKHGNPEEGCV